MCRKRRTPTGFKCLYPNKLRFLSKLLYLGENFFIICWIFGRCPAVSSHLGWEEFPFRCSCAQNPIKGNEEMQNHPSICVCPCSDSTGNVIDLVKDRLPELQLSEEDRQKNLELLEQAKKVSDRFLSRRGRRSTSSLSESPTGMWHFHWSHNMLLFQNNSQKTLWPQAFLQLRVRHLPRALWLRSLEMKFLFQLRDSQKQPSLLAR